MFPQFRLDLLFVFSGFLMFYTSGKLFQAPGSWRILVKKRAIRILPMYWFFTTLILGVAIVMPSQLDSTVFTPLHAIQSYLLIPHFNPALPVTEHAFLRSIHPALGLGWTLMYEALFIVVFAAALALALTSRQALSFIFTVFVFLFALGNAGVFSGMAWEIFLSSSIPFEFVAGGLLSFFIRDGRFPWLTTLITLVLCYSLYFFSHHISLPLDARIFEKGTVAIITLVLVVQLYRPVAIVSPIMMSLADASYSLYLSHPFTLTLVKIMMFKIAHVAVNDVSLWIYFAASLILSILSAIIFYRLVEKPVTRFLISKVKN